MHGERRIDVNQIDFARQWRVLFVAMQQARQRDQIIVRPDQAVFGNGAFALKQAQAFVGFGVKRPDDFNGLRGQRLALASLVASAPNQARLARRRLILFAHELVF